MKIGSIDPSGAFCVAVVLSWGLVVGCVAGGEDPHGISVPGYSGATTDGAVALVNLEAQVDGAERRLDSRPGDVNAAGALADLLLARAHFTGSLDDYDEVATLAAHAVSEHPDDPAAWRLQARALLAVHRFDEARDALETASALGGADDALGRAVDLATGFDVEAIRDARQDLAARFPTLTHLVELATAEAALGRFDVADAFYQQALDAYRDVSPLPVAQVAFQRGVMWSEMAGRRDLGEAYYRQALDRVPGYVVATVHLAEIERERDAERAAARLEALLAATTDPEPAGLLSQILLERDPARAASLADGAAQRYDELLARHRLAFADHAAEFFGGPGDDAARSLELALDNLAVRPVDRSYSIAISAALRAGDDQLAGALAAEASPDAVTVTLRELIDDVLGM